ncbi:hypothetical protein EDC94DRAFT_629077 [Helicostylum pulchrum]|nr:hypothetical protein EDC94DRAFT_629077 [Helicostylum pulchrum]
MCISKLHSVFLSSLSFFKDIQTIQECLNYYTIALVGLAVFALFFRLLICIYKSKSRRFILPITAIMESIEYLLRCMCAIGETALIEHVGMAFSLSRSGGVLQVSGCFVFITIYVHRSPEYCCTPFLGICALEKKIMQTFFFIIIISYLLSDVPITIIR